MQEETYSFSVLSDDGKTEVNIFMIKDTPIPADLRSKVKDRLCEIIDRDASYFSYETNLPLKLTT